MASVDQTLGFSINIFVAGAELSGLRLVEKSNWNGGGVVFPRSSFAQVKQQPEFKKVGVYILLGPQDSGELPKAYIGEGDPVLPRLDDHHARKEFWTSAVFFHGNLNKAHIQYLESRLVKLATEAKRCVLDNTNTPDEPTLNKPDKAMAEGFLQEMLLCFPVLGVNLFEKPPATRPTSVRLLHVDTKGVKANGYETEDGFVVQKHSEASTDEAPSMQEKTKAIRTDLKQQGVLIEHDGKLRFTQDYTFNSPSLAASVIAANSCNGRDMWRDDAGKSLKDIQEQESQVAGS